MTEIYDYLRLLFARVGIPHDPITGLPLTKQTVGQMVDRTLELPDSTRIQVLAPVVKGRKGEYKKEIDEIRAEGFARVRIDGTVYDLSSDEIPALERYKQHTIEIVVDRLVIKGQTPAPGAEEETASSTLAKRLADSFETAVKWGKGSVS